MAISVSMGGVPLFNTPSQKAQMEYIKKVASGALALTAAASAPCPIELQTNPEKPDEVSLKLSFGCILRRSFEFDADVPLPVETVEEAAKRMILSLSDMLIGMGEKYKETVNATKSEVN